jgi:serine/threonine protein kinase
MSEPLISRPADSQAPRLAVPTTAPAATPPTPDVLLGAAGESTDETPTVISKAVPAQAIAPGPGGDMINGNLRGRRLAHFELLEPIGVGGMAAVLRARDTQLDRIVALKILPPEMAREQENVRRFHQEARAAAKLDHENIARVFFCGEDQQLHFIAFEFVEGENLRTLLERRGRLPVAEGIHYMVQIAAGLDHAAARGVVHRDIKPSNVIVTPTGRAKLVDMGLARHLGTPAEGALTQSGVTLGTFDYISPEQALEPRDADVRSDIYSLGCTFYHMLTGQPPVPDGTAAKKLHHHQHVPPLDPRVLNPEIPDAVAAILARMMAKDPNDRYQRPEHLVAHLLQVAQQLGVAPEVPEGILAVESPLPTPPQKRLGLLAGLAVGGLAAILVLLSLLPTEPTPAAISSPARATAAPTEPPISTGPSAEAKAAVKTRRGAVRTEKELIAAAGRAHILLEGVIDLGQGRVKLRGAAGGSQTLEAEGAPAVIHLSPDVSTLAGNDEPWAGFLAEGATINFTNLVFRLDVDQTPESIVAAVAVTRARQVTFRRCAFVQKAPREALLREPHRIPAASVAVASPGLAQPRVSFDECYFVEGQTAVAVGSGADIFVNNCAFGPHGALFQVGGKSKNSEAALSLTNCSAFIVNGPAFRLDEEGACSLKVQNCIFSCPDTAPRPVVQLDFPELIHVTTKGKRVSYADARTCYHGLTSFWTGADDLAAVTWDGFRERAHSFPSGTDSSFWLNAGNRSPWLLPEPLAAIRPADPGDRSNQKAFQISAELPELRQAPSGSESRLALGVQKCVWGEFAPLPELPPTFLARPGRKIVDPAVKGGAGGIYESLNGALADARPGDVILLKKNGPLEVYPVPPKVDLSVTIRPYEDCRPVLVLSRKTTEIEAALFRVTHASLKFEGVAFELAPSLPDFKSQAVVRLLGTGQCSFKDCLFTLKGSSGVTLCVAALEASDGKTMPMPENQPPRVSFTGNCLVRGEGDLVRVAQSRPFVLSVANSAIALDGSLLSVGASQTESPPAQGAARVDLRKVTTYLTGHLVLLEDSQRAGKGLAKTNVEARDCLFLPARDRSLVQIRGLNYKAERERVFSWKGQHNAYCSFDKVLDQQPAMVDVPAPNLDSTEWGMTYNESDKDSGSRFVRVRLDLEGPSDGLFARLVPQKLRLRSDQVDGYGANLEDIALALGLDQGSTAEESSATERKQELRDRK